MNIYDVGKRITSILCNTKESFREPLIIRKLSALVHIIYLLEENKLDMRNIRSMSIDLFIGIMLFEKLTWN